MNKKAEIFKPNATRQLLLELSIICGAITLSAIFKFSMSGGYNLRLMPGMFFAVIMLGFVFRYFSTRNGELDIILNDQEIEGPGFVTSSRSSIPLANIDFSTVVDRTIFQRIGGVTIIRDFKRGDKIVISHLAFEADERKKIIKGLLAKGPEAR